MHRRRIQLVGGTSYAVSLPKGWVKENKLSPKAELLVYEKNDRTLLLSPHAVERKSRDDISINIDEHVGNVDQILFALYYVGFETITLFSGAEFSKDTRSRIRKTLTHMSGTEITHEDKNRITVRVMLDVSKVQIDQVFYRISLIIDSSLTNMMEGLNISEIRINENEVDRLYHLTSKMLSLSLIDSNVLHSSGLKNISLLPAHFLIAKKMENLADNIKHLADYLHSSGKRAVEHDVLEFVQRELSRSVDHLRNRGCRRFVKADTEDLKIIDSRIEGLKDKIVQKYLSGMVRQVMDIQQETVYISFYRKMIEERFV